MRPSSIFSFDTLRFRSSTCRGTGVMLLVALGVLLSMEGLARLVPAPKGLPFHTTRAGSLVDHLFRERPRLDLLFLGNSQCACNVSPHHVVGRWLERGQRSLAAFNLGMPGASLATTDVLHGTLTRWVEPRTVVFVVSFALSEGRPNPRIVSSYGMDWIQRKRPWPEVGLMELELFRYRRMFRDLRYETYVVRDRDLAGDRERRVGPYGLGWRPLQGGFVGREENLAGRRAASRSELGPMAQAAVASLLERAARQRSRVVLLVPPHPPRFLGLMPNPEAQWASLTRQLRRIAGPTGAVVVDHHALPSLGDDQFNDRTHMLPEAARRYSALLADALFDLESDEPR